MAGGVNGPRPTSESPKHLDDLMPMGKALEMAADMEAKVSEWVRFLPPGFAVSVKVEPYHRSWGQPIIFSKEASAH